MTNVPTKPDLDAIVAAIEFPTDIHLVYVDYRDELSDRQVAEVLRDGYSESADEWADEARWEGACDLADELFADAASDLDPDDDIRWEWGGSGARYDLIGDLMDLDKSDPLGDLLRNTPAMLFRHVIGDDPLWCDPDALSDPSDLYDALNACGELDGFDWNALTAAFAKILPEIAGYSVEGGHHFQVHVVYTAQPSDLHQLHGCDAFTISGSFLWVTNPYQGNGWGTEFAGDVQIPWPPVLDCDAAGYSANEVFGGLLIDEADVTDNSKERTE